MLFMEITQKNIHQELDFGTTEYKIKHRVVTHHQVDSDLASYNNAVLASDDFSLVVDE